MKYDKQNPWPINININCPGAILKSLLSIRMGFATQEVDEKNEGSVGNGPEATVIGGNGIGRSRKDLT